MNPLSNLENTNTPNQTHTGEISFTSSTILYTDFVTDTVFGTNQARHQILKDWLISAHPTLPTPHTQLLKTHGCSYHQLSRQRVSFKIPLAAILTWGVPQILNPACGGKACSDILSINLLQAYNHQESNTTTAKDIGVDRQILAETNDCICLKLVRLHIPD